MQFVFKKQLCCFPIVLYCIIALSSFSHGVHALGRSTKRSHGRVFPYVVAGDPSKLLPEQGLSPEELPRPSLPDIPVLQESIEKLLEEARAAQTQREDAARMQALLAAQLQAGLAGVVISGPGAANYISAGYAGVIAASKMTTAERFGRGVAAFTTLTAILAGFPFCWFTVSGGARQLSNYFIAASCGFTAHAFILAWELNLNTWSTAAAIQTSLILGILVGAAGFYLPQILWRWVILWFFLILLCFLRCLPLIGPLGYIGKFPGVSDISGFYAFLVSLSALLLVAHMSVFARASTKVREAMNATVIGGVCSWVAISALASVLETSSGVVSPFGYLQFLSIPGTLNFETLTPGGMVLLACFVGFWAMGIWIHMVRYKQSGLQSLKLGSPSGEEAYEEEYAEAWDAALT